MGQFKHDNIVSLRGLVLDGEPVKSAALRLVYKFDYQEHVCLADGSNRVYGQRGLEAISSEFKVLSLTLLYHIVVQ